jgi:hypothetical protein
MRLMQKGGTELSRDLRAITGIFWEAGGENRVGQNGVTKIEAYDENGSMSHVPWLAVFKGDEIVSRVPADQVMVSYEPPQPVPF